MNIESISKGRPKNLTDRKGLAYTSGIHKQKTDMLEVSSEIISGDEVANPAFHGGPDRVLCFYPVEHYFKWKKEYGIQLLSPAFGENLTVSGMTEDTVCIGDQFQIGSVVAEVSQGRYPCATINRHTGIDQLLGRIIETGFTGYFMRIIQAGTINAADPIKRIKRVSSVSVADIHHTFFHNRSDGESIRRILDLEPLAEDWKKKFRKLSERAGS